MSLTIRAAGGKVDVSPMSAALYQGTLAGAVSVNANTNAFAIKQNLTGININPLMKDAINKDILEGRGNINLDVTTSGATPSALKKALNGTTAINLRDGAYKGINLAKSFREAKAMLGGGGKEKTQDANKEEKTDFTEMKISAVIKNGVATSNDLDAKSPFVRLGGEGTVNLGENSMDYLAKATVVGNPAGQGADLGALKGVTVPVKLHGPLDAMKYDIQYGAIAAGAVTEKAKSAVEDKLKGLLGGKKADAPAAGAPAAGAPASGQAQQQKPQSAEEKAKEKLRGLFGR